MQELHKRLGILEQRTSKCKKTLNLYTERYTKTNSKWIADLNVKAKTVQLLEENKVDNLCDNGVGKYVLRQGKKAQTMKEKVN